MKYVASVLALLLALTSIAAGAAPSQGHFYGVAELGKEYLQVEVCLAADAGVFIDRNLNESPLKPTAGGWQVTRKGQPAGRWVLAPKAKALAGSGLDGKWLDVPGHPAGSVQIVRIYAPVPLQPGCGPVRRQDGVPPMRAASVSAGDSHTCAATSDGRVACWGGGAWPTTASEPAVPDLHVDAIVAVSGDCGLRRDGHVACWDQPDRKPRGVGGVEHAVALSGHCVLTAAGDVFCWGANDYGQLGNGRESASAFAVRVPGLAHVVSLSSSGLHSCAALSDGRVACWGNLNEPHGKFGDTDPDATRHYRVFIPDITNAVAVSAGTFEECALLRDGHVKCWSDDAEADANADADSSASPARSIDDAVAISAGTHYACVLRRDGDVGCWGENGDGQLGDAGIAAKLPLRVVGVEHAIALTTGYQHACAILAGGTLKCWGRSNFGALGHLDGWAKASGGARAAFVPGFEPSP